MNIITGYTGEPHITSAQDRDGNQGSYGEESYILNVGYKLEASIVSANEIRIADGALSHQGCLGNIDRGSYESLAISNGTQGMKRSDLIVCRYEKDAETNVESLSLVVIEGTSAASNPADPTYNTGNIQEGDSPVDFPLYRVNINGVNVSSVTRLAPFVRTQKEMDTLLGNTSISGIGNGTVTGALSTLNGKVNDYQTANCTITNGAGTISLIKSGNVVTARVNQVNTSVGALTDFGTIPTGFIPKQPVYCPLSFPTDGTMISFTTSGKLQLNKATTNNMYGSCTYIV